MGRIKHIAIRTDDVEKTSTFYKEVFGLQQVGLGRNGVYLSDGHINLAILRRQPEIEGGDKVGIDHLGFKVDDVHETLSALKQRGGEPVTDPVTVIPTDPSDAQSYYEIKCLGPDGQVIDVSGSGWVGND
jgi:catechol 2,3-dioxygenase-like lactoylglutathione lyase family enzyme